MKRLLFIGVFLVTVVSLIPVQSDAAGLVPCGGFEFDKDGNRIIQAIEDPVPEGWQKISATEIAKTEPSCNFCQFFKLGENVTNFFLFPTRDLNGGFAVVPLVAGLLFAVGGIYLLLGAGNPSFYEKGRKTLYAVVIGLVIVYAAWVFVNTFLMFLGVAEWTGLGRWWEISCGI